MDKAPEETEVSRASGALLALLISPALLLLSAGLGGGMSISIPGVAMLCILTVHPATTIWVISRAKWSSSLRASRCAIAVAIACSTTWWGLYLRSERFSELPPSEKAAWISKTSFRAQNTPTDFVGSRSGFPIQSIEGVDGGSVHFEITGIPSVNNHKFGIYCGIKLGRGLLAFWTNFLLLGLTTSLCVAFIPRGALPWSLIAASIYLATAIVPFRHWLVHDAW